MLTRDDEAKFEAVTGRKPHMISREWLAKTIIMQDIIRRGLQKEIAALVKQEQDRKAAEFARKHNRLHRKVWRWVRGR